MTVSEQGSLLGMNVPLLVFIGLGVGVGSVIVNIASDYLVDRLFSDSTIKTMERNIVEIGLGATGAVLGGKYLSGLPPSLDLAILSGTSYFGSEYLYDQDNMLLGRLF
jgi:hypothetical protein